MLIAAAKDLGINLQTSWMVGDGLNDVQAGREAGCRTILVTTLKTEHLEHFISKEDMCPDYAVSNLEQALKIIQQCDGNGVV